MDTSWVTEVAPLRLGEWPDESSLTLDAPPPPRILSLSAFIPSFSFFKPKALSVAPLPDTNLLEGVGLLSGALVLEDESSGGRCSLQDALANLETYRSSLAALLLDNNTQVATGTDGARLVARPDATVAAASLAKGYMHAAIACALYLADGGQPSETNTEVAGILNTCIDSAFVLYGCLASVEDGHYGSACTPVREQLDETLSIIEGAVVASFFPLDNSLSPLLSYARDLAESLVATKPKLLDDQSLSADSHHEYHIASAICETLTQFAQRVTGLAGTPRTTGPALELDPSRFAAELHALAAELAISLMAYETRQLGTLQPKWLEDARGVVDAALDGVLRLLEHHVALPLVLDPLSQGDYFGTEGDDDADGDDKDTSADDTEASDVDMWEEPDTSLLSAITRLTDRFIEADEGFRRQCPDLMLSNTKVNTGRSSVEKKYKSVVCTLVEIMKGAKEETSKNNGKRKRKNDDEESKARRQVSEIVKELKNYGIPQAILDDILRPFKRPRISDSSVNSRRSASALSRSASRRCSTE